MIKIIFAIIGSLLLLVMAVSWLIMELKEPKRKASE